MNQSKNSGGFVTGTLIYTQTGLKPIEQIQVGDFVLSKSETGEQAYKRVINTFEYDDKEVWFVRYVILTEDYTKMRERSFFIATGEHPVRVKGYIDNKGELHELNIWEPVCELAKELYLYGGGAVMELHDGRFANVDTLRVGGLLMRSDIPDYGVVAQRSFLDTSYGFAIIFNEGQPELLTDDDIVINADDQLDWRDFPKGSVGRLNFGFPPLLRKVYNLEVEDFHTYFVGEHGVLVHDAIQQTS